jgi:hypothetical protein
MLLKILNCYGQAKRIGACCGIVFMLSSFAMTALCIWKAWEILEIWDSMAGAVCSASYGKSKVDNCDTPTLNDIVAAITIEIQSAAKVSYVTGGMNTITSVCGMVTGCMALSGTMVHDGYNPF